MKCSELACCHVGGSTADREKSHIMTSLPLSQILAGCLNVSGRQSLMSSWLIQHGGVSLRSVARHRQCSFHHPSVWATSSRVLSPQTVSCPSDSDVFNETSVRPCENQLITAIIHTRRRTWTNSHCRCISVSCLSVRERTTSYSQIFFAACDRLYWKWPNAEMRPVID